MKTKPVLWVIAIILFSCTASENLIPITEIQLPVIPSKKSDRIVKEKRGQFKIYRTDPLDEKYETTYWLRVFKTKNEKNEIPDFVVCSKKIYDQAKYKWENDSTLTITLLNTDDHHAWRWTLIKNETNYLFKKDPEQP